MHTYLVSLVAFAAAANLVALPLIYLGRRKGQPCKPMEYLMIYLTWVLFVGLIGFIFHGLDAAFTEWKISQSFAVVFFAIAGGIGGLSLLPKLLPVCRKFNPVVVTTVTSVIVAATFTKFSVLVFLFTGD